MIKVELFGKSCIFGFVGHRFRFHCVTAERIKTFKDLVFRVHPTGLRKQKARADFKNGCSAEIVPVIDEGEIYYDFTAIKGESRVTLTYCTENEVDMMLEHFQTR